MMKNLIKSLRARPHFTNTDCLITTYPLTSTTVTTNICFQMNIASSKLISKTLNEFSLSCFTSVHFLSPSTSCSYISHGYAMCRLELVEFLSHERIANSFPIDIPQRKWTWKLMWFWKKTWIDAFRGVQFSGVGMLFSFVQLSINKRD